MDYALLILYNALYNNVLCLCIYEKNTEATGNLTADVECTSEDRSSIECFLFSWRSTFRSTIELHIYIQYVKFEFSLFTI